MKLFKIVGLGFICTLMFVGTVHAEDNAQKGIKLGFGHDRGFGVVGTIGNFNGFIGNDGLAVDYIFIKTKLNVAKPLYWYVGAGGFADWDGDFGVRVPVGVEFHFAKNLDVYAQVIPTLEYNNHKHNNINHNHSAAELKEGFGLGVRYQF